MKACILFCSLLAGLYSKSIQAQEVRFNPLFEDTHLNLTSNSTAPLQGIIHGFIAVPRGVLKMQATALLVLDDVASQIYQKVEESLPAEMRDSANKFAYKCGQVAGYISFLAVLDYLFRSTEYYKNLEGHHTFFRILTAMATLPPLEILRHPALWTFDPVTPYKNYTRCGEMLIKSE